MTTERNTRFLARYFHDGAWWEVQLYASDFEDAQEICNAHNLQLDGQHVVTIPAGVGSWVPEWITRIANWFNRK